MTANDFTNLHLQYLSTQAEGELPATIEHDFHNGRMVDHYFVTPSPNFWNDEAIKALEGVTGIMFLQQPDGAPWKILVNDTTMFKEVYFDFPEEEFRRMLANSHRKARARPGPPPCGGPFYYGILPFCVPFGDPKET